MSWGLALGGLGALAGGLGSFFGGQRQAQGYRDAAAESAALAREAMALQEPWRQAGLGVLPVLQREVGDGFTASPGYEWLLGETQRATNQDMAARGLWGSGARGRALQRNAAGLAAQDYGNWFNRAASLAGLGQAATNQGAGALTGAIPSIASSTAGAGSASGASIAGLGNMAQGFGNNFLTMYALGLGPFAQQPPPQYTPWQRSAPGLAGGR